MIRQLNPPDVESVLTIWLEASIQAHHFVPKSFWEDRLEDMRKVYLPLANTLVYDEGGAIKGFISLHEDTVAALFVAPAYQGLGIGKALLTHAQRDRSHLKLTVYRENRRGVAFYQKGGFAIQCEQVDPHTGHPELMMTFQKETG